MHQGTAEPAAPVPAKDRSRLRWRLFGLSFAALALGAGMQLYMEHGRIQDSESERLLDVSRTVSNNISRQFEGLSAALDGLRDDYRSGVLAANDSRSTRQLQLLAAGMPAVNSLVVINAQGSAVVADQPRLLGGDHTDADYFQLPKSRPDRYTLFVSRPSPDLLNGTTLFLSKNIFSDSGEFLGVVSAGLSEDFFSTIVRSALFAPDMRATLIHADGTVFLTVPRFDTARRRSLATPGSLFTRHMQGGLERDVLSGMGPVSGASRVIAYSNVRPPMLGLDKPVVLALSRDPSAMFSVWREQARYRTVVFLGVMLLAAGVRIWGHRRQRALSTVREEAQQALDASAVRLEHALEGASLGLWEMNLRDGSLLFDARGCAMLGYGPGDIASSLAAWTGLMHPAEREATMASFERYLTTGSEAGYEHEFRMRHRDGRWVWLLARGKVARYGRSGRPAGIIGTAMDLSERKAREDELARALLLMRHSGQLAKVGGWVLETHGSQLTWTDEVYRIHDLSPALQPDLSAAIGFYAPEARALVALAMDKCRSEGAPWDMELEIISAQGHRKWVHTQGEPVYEEGQLVRIVGALQDVTERKRAVLELERVNTALAKMSYTDALTALGNRRLFDDALAAEWNRAARSAEPLSILMIDIDYFKRYNDLYGHIAGDRCLQQVAMVLQGALHRIHEKAMRYGGEEFAILLPNTDLAGAEVVARRVLGSIAAADVCHDDSPLGPRVTVSVGAASCQPRAEAPPATLLREADQALYRAKEAGRGRVVVAA